LQGQLSGNGRLWVQRSVSGVRQSDKEGKRPVRPSAVGEWEQKLHILDAFHGRYFFTLPNEAQEGGSASFGMSTAAASGSAPQVNISLSQDAGNDCAYRLYA